MFDNLSGRFDGIIKRIRGKGRLTESDVDEVMKEIRTALLEADVNVTVVRSVCNRIREHAIGATRSQALDPGQQVVKAVNDELTRALGGETLAITYAPKPPTVVLMAGLQGSGKTTNSAKLASWFKAQGRQPLLVGADLQRPAAVEQLSTLGTQIDVPVYSDPEDPMLTAVRRPRGGQAARARRRDRRHRGPTVDRRRDDGTGPADLRCGRSRLHVPRHRRDDRSGRRADRRGVPRHAADRRRHHVEARRRRQRWRRSVGERGHRPADRLRFDGREGQRVRAVPPRSHGRRASSAWATCSR